jgi:hypothetical protein
LQVVVHEAIGHHSRTPDLPQQALAHLHLWLLQRQLPLVTPSTATSLVLSAAVQMLQAAAGQAADLAAKGHDMAHFEAACRSARQTLDATASTRAQQASSDFDLPPLDAAASPCGPGSYRCPRGRIPAPVHVSHDDSGGIDAARQRAEGNLGSLPLLQLGTFDELLALLRLPEMQAPSSVAVSHALCTVERELFQRAACADGFSLESALPPSEVDALVEVVHEYHKGEPSSTVDKPGTKGTPAAFLLPAERLADGQFVSIFPGCWCATWWRKLANVCDSGTSPVLGKSGSAALTVCLAITGTKQLSTAAPHWRGCSAAAAACITGGH